MLADHKLLSCNSPGAKLLAPTHVLQANSAVHLRDSANESPETQLVEFYNQWFKLGLL